MKNYLKQTMLVAFLCLCCFVAKAQDIIVKINGDTISAKILEVGTSTVTYKKINIQNGPTYVDNKIDIEYIEYAGGYVERFAKASQNKLKNNEQNKETTVSSETNKLETTIKEETADKKDDGKVKIEYAGKKYKINGKAATRKEVDKQLATSKNPAILVPLKAAKLGNTFQKISKITSIGTYAVGGSALLITLADLINDFRRKRDNTSTYLSPAISLVSTAALPTTSKILKKRGDKTRQKLIDIYNVTN